MRHNQQYELYSGAPTYEVIVAWGVGGLQKLVGSAEDAFVGDAPIWDADFNASSAAAQMAALDLCERAARLPQHGARGRKRLCAAHRCTGHGCSQQQGAH